MDNHTKGIDMPEKYPFLSDEWIAEAKKIREQHAGEAPTIPHQVKMNQVITSVPFGEGTVHAHLDTTNGLELDLGHLDSADLTVTLEYETAKAILVEGNPQAGMQAFMAGKIKVEGDMAKLMALQSTSLDLGGAAAVAQQIKDITA